MLPVLSDKLPRIESHAFLATCCLQQGCWQQVASCMGALQSQITWYTKINDKKEHEQVIKIFQKNRDEEDWCHKKGGNKESSYITHHNHQSDSTFLKARPWPNSIKNVESD